jgi:hypothetical protein
MKRLIGGVCLALLLTAGAGAAEAQDVEYRNVISVNPFGLLLDFFNVEYERAIAPTQTAGFGGSTITSSYEEWTGGDVYATRTARYLNADVFWRYHPSGIPFEGWNLGIKAGITSISSDAPGEDGGTYFGYGFDANRSWLLGPTNRLYLSTGFGLKRILGADEEFLKYVPTFRVINVGFTF